jgi:hypothetical protein
MFVNVMGSVDVLDCIPCTAGKYVAAKGSTAAIDCIDCEKGKYVMVAGSAKASLCILCPAGRYVDDEGSDDVARCKDCPSGTYVSRLGSIDVNDCLECASGKYVDATGSSEKEDCIDCLIGKYVATVGSNDESDCILCVPGMFVGHSGSIVCQYCPAGRKSFSGFSECDECAKGEVCPVGTSADDLRKKMVTTEGSLQLVGITEDGFDSIRAKIVQAIRQHFNTTNGIWLSESNIELSRPGPSVQYPHQPGRRLPSTSVLIKFSLTIPNDWTNGSNASTSDASAAGSSAVTQLIAASIESQAPILVIPVENTVKQHIYELGDCPAGKYADEGAGECTACAPGRQRLPQGTAECKNCAPGYFANLTGTVVCTRCPSGKYQEDVESTVCLTCRAHADTLSASASKVEQCVCDQQYFYCASNDQAVCSFDECNQCPDDATCNQSETLESLRSKGGFWRATNNTNIFYPCVRPASCKGERIVNGSRDTQCTEGYVGVKCELCDYDNNYAIHQPGAQCTKCQPGEGQDSFLVGLLTICILCILGVVSALDKWPQQWTRIRRGWGRVAIRHGTHAGRTGVLVGSTSQIDELSDALVQRDSGGGSIKWRQNSCEWAI